MLVNLDFPIRVFGQFTALLWHKMSHVISSCHWHTRGNPLLCHGWLSSPELHSIFCTIRTHTDYYCDSSWWVVSMLKACGWIWKISNTTSYSKLHTNRFLTLWVWKYFPLGLLHYQFKTAAIESHIWIMNASLCLVLCSHSALPGPLTWV